MPKVIGGDFPMNPQFQQILNTYLTFGEILEFFFDRKGAAKDPRYQFYQSPIWFQQQQILLQKAQLALQNQQMAQQMAQQQQMAAQQSQLADQSQEQPPSPPMGKSEKEMGEWFAKNDAYLKQTINDNSREIQKLILKRHSDFVKNTVGKFKKDAENAVEEIADIVSPKKAEE
jgi:DNA anti-recombination protein RmuC